MKKNNILNYFNLNIDNKEIRILLAIIVILVLILIFRKLIGIVIEKILVFLIVFLLFICLSKNLLITIICSIIIFLFLNLIMNYKNTIEKFEDIKKEESKPENIAFDKNIFETNDVKKASDGLKELLKKMNGGIELKDEDLKETGIININTDKYKDDKIPNPLKQAQKETYELIDTVNTLKDTITTLAPVLKEGKKLIDIFHNLKI